MRYVHTGKLTDAIPAEKVGLAQDYLAQDDMTAYLPTELDGKVLHIRWNLSANGHDYTVEAIAAEELSDADLNELNEWVSGQNSDGLGEGFEQQDFAWVGGEEPSRWSWDEDDEDEDEGHMVSFDWETNEVKFRRIKHRYED